MIDPLKYNLSVDDFSVLLKEIEQCYLRDSLNRITRLVTFEDVLSLVLKYHEKGYTNGRISQQISS